MPKTFIMFTQWKRWNEKNHNKHRISSISYFKFQRKNSPFIVARTFEICILLWIVNSPSTVNSYLFWLVQTRQIPSPIAQILITDNDEKLLHSPVWSENGTRTIESTAKKRKKKEEYFVSIKGVLISVFPIFV